MRPVIPRPSGAGWLIKFAPNVKGTPDFSYDAATVQIDGAHFTKEQITHFSPLTDSDVQGRLVLMTGIRPDTALGRSGRKRYAGFGVEMTDPIYAFFQSRFSGRGKEHLRKSIMVVTETAEALTVFNEAMRRNLAPAKGVSGGVGGVHINHRYEPALPHFEPLSFESDPAPLNLGDPSPQVRENRFDALSDNPTEGQRRASRQPADEALHRLIAIRKAVLILKILPDALR